MDTVQNHHYSIKAIDQIENKLNQTLKAERASLVTKSDIRLLNFDHQQVKMYKKIRNAKSTLEKIFKLGEPQKLMYSTRRLKSIQMENEKNFTIKKENQRLYR